MLRMAFAASGLRAFRAAAHRQRARQECAPFTNTWPTAVRCACASAFKTDDGFVGEADVAGGGEQNGGGGGGGTVVPRAPSSSSPSSYGAEQIRVLEGLEAVRLRPGMYIGSTGTRGLHHLVYEIVDNAVDEAQAGHASGVWVSIHKDGSVEVRDNGRGIPCERHAQTGKSTLETVLTVLHSGGKFGGEQSGYRVSGGLHGVGVSVVNALSSSLEIVVRRGDGVEYAQRFSRGEVASEMEARNVADLDADMTVDVSAGDASALAGMTSGTAVRFMPDELIFKSGNRVDYDTILVRLRELAFLNSGIVFNVRGPNDDTWDRIVYEGGLGEYVDFLTSERKRLHDVLCFSTKADEVEIECAMVWCEDSYSDSLLGYANSVRTAEGGSHIDGLKSGLTRLVNSLAKKYSLVRDDGHLGGDHVREGLFCVLSVKIPQPEFEGQTKTKLGNPSVRKLVDSAVVDEVGYKLERMPDEMKEVIKKVINSKRAADAARKAREMVRIKSSARSSTLPGKLSDCTVSDPAQREIFLVEGDSAGGSAKLARDRRFQAILPLKGKIMNVEKKIHHEFMKNEEIRSLIVALGLGSKPDDESYSMSQLRYHKIIIMTDADVDGAHIRTLILTFLYRFQKRLFEDGLVYMAVPPLYKVTTDTGSRYAQDDESLAELMEELPKRGRASVQRFKGLGEMMPDQLWETSLNPDTVRNSYEDTHTHSLTSQNHQSLDSPSSRAPWVGLEVWSVRDMHLCA